jgi:alpha-tubulin suppressor-like RCC1 family protein
VLLAVAITGRAAAESASAPGQLYAFGENEWGQLGNALGNGASNPHPAPALVGLPGGIGSVVQSAGGGGFSLVLTSTGQVYAFGENRFGQLGDSDGNGTAEAHPIPAPVSLPGASGPAVQVAAGDAHSLVLTSSGQLYTFGENRFGQLGRAANAGSENANPVPAPVVLPGATGIPVEIAAGAEHSLALTSSGQLYAFGDNRFGQLGSPTNTGSDSANATPARVTLPGAVGQLAQIAAGLDHSLALTSAGELYAFGDNVFGQLGSAANSESSSPNPTPARVALPGAGGAVRAIAAGGSHSLALTTSGELYAFGENDFGQLGDTRGNGTHQANPTPQAVRLPLADGPPIAIAAGAEHTLAIATSGALYAFGSNEFGALGSASNSGTPAPNPTPTPVAAPGATTFDAVAQGPSAEHSLAVIADLAILNGSLPAGQVGVAYSSSGVASGGAGAYSWSARGLPSGLSIDPSSGRIGGIPATTETSDVVLRVVDAFGVAAASAPMPLTIGPAASGPPPFRFSTLTEAQLRTSLRQQLGMKGRLARFAALRRRRSYTYAFTALTAGTLAIEWYYLPPGARLARRVTPVLFARGRTSFATAGTRTITLRLTTAGRRLLRHRRALALTAKGSFTPTGARTVTATKRFNVTR